MKKLFFAALALTAMVACSKDDVPTDDVLTSSEKSVFISIANMASGTRAETEGGKTTAATEGTKASTELSRIYILFADASGKIIQVKTGLTGPGPFQFHKIPAVVTQVAAVGNLTSPPEPDDNLSEYDAAWKTEVVNAEYQDLVVYSGAVNLQPNGTWTDEEDEHPKYTAEVTVQPYMARIEISQISCTNFGAQYSGYDAIGVTKMTLAGDGDVINPGDTKNKPYIHNLGSFDNDTELMAGGTSDWVMKPTDAVLTAGTGKVWSWNIVPQDVSNLTTDLYVSGWSYTTSVPVRKVVITGYKTGLTDIESFAGGRIYQFAINFASTNIESVEDYLCAEVTVSILPWTIVPTEVVFNTHP